MSNILKVGTILRFKFSSKGNYKIIVEIINNNRYKLASISESRYLKTYTTSLTHIRTNFDILKPNK